MSGTFNNYLYSKLSLQKFQFNILAYALKHFGTYEHEAKDPPASICQ